MKKKLNIFLVPLVIFMISTILFIQKEFILSILFLFFLPFTGILFFGSFKNRLLNLLPLFLILTYLVLGFQYSLWKEGIYLFSLYPILGLVIKPKRSVLKYITVGFSSVLFILNYYEVLSISFGVKLIITILLYLIFLPPIIEKWLKIDKNYPLLFQIIAPVYGFFFSSQVKNFKNSLSKGEKEIVFKKNETIIDIGCGTGALASVLSKEYFLQVTAIDPTMNMLKVAKRKNKNTPIKFLQENVLNGLSFADKTFDYACASYVAHGLQKEERMKMYLEMKRVSKKMILLFEYNTHRNLGTDIIEYLEGGDYFEFIKNVQSELSHVFEDIKIIEVSSMGSLYLCRL